MALTVVRDPVTGVSFPALGGQRAYLFTEDGQFSFSFEFAPSVITYDGLEQDWVQVDRVGTWPLLVRKASKLDTIQFSIKLTDKRDYFAEQTGHLDALRKLARAQKRVMFKYSTAEAGLWRITACSQASELRHPVSNAIIRVTAEVTLTRASDPAPSVGPVSNTSAPPAVAKVAAAPAPARTVVVGRGDSLWSISARMYGNGAAWPRLFDANRAKIKLPWLIQPGMVLVVP